MLLSSTFDLVIGRHGLCWVSEVQSVCLHPCRSDSWLGPSTAAWGGMLSTEQSTHLCWHIRVACTVQDAKGHNSPSEFYSGMMHTLYRENDSGIDAIVHMGMCTITLHGQIMMLHSSKERDTGWKGKGSELCTGQIHLTIYYYSLS